MSLYSFLAFKHLLRNREALKSHDVDIEWVLIVLVAQIPSVAQLTSVLRFHPVFLGGINVGSGNKPPWTLPAKAKYYQFENERAKNYFGEPHIQKPAFFPMLSILVRQIMILQKHSYVISPLSMSLIS